MPAFVIVVIKLMELVKFTRVEKRVAESFIAANEEFATVPSRTFKLHLQVAL